VSQARSIVRATRSAQSARARERTFELLFMACPLPTWVYDTDSQIFMEANDAALALCGYSRTELAQLHLADLFPRAAPAVRPVEPACGHCGGGGDANNAVWRHVSRDGQAIDMLVTVRCLDLAGQPATLLVGRVPSETGPEVADHTCLRAAELARLRDDFVAAIGHELRTPLTAIMGYADLLTARWDLLTEPQRRAHTERIRAGATRLHRLVDDLLLARRDRTVLLPRCALLDLAEIVRQAVATVEPRYPDQTFTVLAQDMPVAWADAEWVLRVLVHLLDNAARYSAVGSPVIVRWAFEGQQVALRVEDRGPGVPTQSRPFLFTSFGRAGGTTRAGRVGIGLGLYLGRRLAQAMGGSLDLEQTGPTGSVFCLRLPHTADAPTPGPGR